MDKQAVHTIAVERHIKAPGVGMSDRLGYPRRYECRFREKMWTRTPVLFNFVHSQSKNDYRINMVNLTAERETEQVGQT